MELERILSAAYAAKNEQFVLALELLSRLQNSIDRDESGEQDLEHLRRILDEVAAIDHRSSEVKRLWKTSGKKPGPELNVAIDRAAQLLGQLLELIGAAEQRALDRMGSLLPQLDQSIRGQQMQRAYGREPIA